jgi:hypothetical protein
MLSPPMVIKRKNPALPFPTLRNINRRVHKLILLRLRLSNNMAVGVDDARPAD